MRLFPQQVLSLSRLLYINWEDSCPDRTWREHNYYWLVAPHVANSPRLELLLWWFYFLFSLMVELSHCLVQVFPNFKYKFSFCSLWTEGCSDQNLSVTPCCPGWHLLSISNISALISWSIHVLEGDKSELYYELYLGFSPDKCIKREHSWISEYIVSDSGNVNITSLATILITKVLLPGTKMQA